jgi:preprotein translocase subunit SecD
MVLNKYPLWKNALVVVILLMGLLYALPNAFGDDPALQISSLKTAELDQAAQAQVILALEQADIPYQSEFEKGDLLLRFNNADAQLQAKDLLTPMLGNDYIVALNLAPAVPNWMRFIGANPMKLGLDLRGGVHFLLQVDVPAAEERYLDSFAETLRTRLREDSIRYRNVTAQGDELRITFNDETMKSEGMSLIRREFPGLQVSDTRAANNLLVSFKLTDAEQKEVRDYALDQSMITLRNRVNELGVAEAVVRRQGLDRIVVELPGVQDTARAKEILGKTASLSFHMVNNDYDPSQYVNSRPPAGTVLYYDRDGRPWIFDRRVVLSGDNIVGAQSGFDEYGKPAVFIQLGGSTRYFSKITGENIGNGMGSVFVETRFYDKEENGETVRVSETTYDVISVATIQSRLGNRFQITNLQSAEESRNLALLLRAGALPAPIDYVQERVIGPSLGAENIKKGLVSLGAGLLLVLIFMAIYYNAFGVIADIALLVNLVLIAAVLSLIGATLTLPGIAGIVLTMGMAVDANVLIFERIREELRNGQSPQSSIQAGFDKAFSTIVDAQLTTFIAALALFSMGSGPVKGFAITLIIGLLTSVFTAVMVSRAMVNFTFGGKTLKKLAIGI